MLKIHEMSSATGELSPIFLRFDTGMLEILTAEEVFKLPESALAAVMARFGAPFDPEARITRVATLSLSLGVRLHHVRHLAGYDVIARDYIVYDAGKGDALCALATTVTAALVHLGRAVRAAG